MDPFPKSSPSSPGGEVTLYSPPMRKSNEKHPGSPKGSRVTKTRVKQAATAKNWCFTWHNYPEDWEDACKRLPGQIGGVVGEEKTSSDGPHLQGYLQFEARIRPMGMGLPKQVHWEAAKGTAAANYKYCSKEGRSIVWGTMSACVPYRKELPEPHLWQVQLLAMLQAEPDDRTILWVWEQEGNVGKTTFCKHVISCHPEIGAIISGGKAGDVQNQVVDCQNNGKLPRTIIWDIPRSFNKEYLCWHGIEALKNMLFYSGKYEGGMICGPCPHLLIFANERPDFTKLSLDRWAVYRIQGGELVPDECMPRES